MVLIGRSRVLSVARMRSYTVSYMQHSRDCTLKVMTTFRPNPNDPRVGV